MASSIKALFRRKIKKDNPEAPQLIAADSQNTPDQSTSAAKQPEPDEVRKRPTNDEFYTDLKRAGALDFWSHGPSPHSEQVVAEVYWDGKVDNKKPWILGDEKKGFVKAMHPSFEYYRRRKFIKRVKPYGETQLDAEYHTFFDVESDPRYENENPGTVTVEGFGLECWDYEVQFGVPRKKMVFVSGAQMPTVSGGSMLRRLHEFQKDLRPLDLHREIDDLDLKEFVGDLGVIYFDKERASDPERWFDHLLSVLNRAENRSDIFADFRTSASVARVWNGPRSEEVIGLWNFLRQVIISKELARRLEFYNGATGVSLTSSIVASLIIADLWVQNVTISLVDAKVDTSTKRTVTDEEANKAQQLITEGDDANTGKDHDSALKLYAKAVGIDPHNPVYLSRHAGALLLTERIERAAMEAYMATYFDPMYAGGWECLALTQLKRGHARKAKQSYEKALEIADSAIQPRLNQGLTIANNMIEFKRQAINSANTNAWKRTLIKEYLDEDWDMSCKAYRIRSRVHERQAEGLLQFAERLKWPYIKEARTRIEDVYGELQSGQEIDHHLIDWLFGVMLPGKWFSFKIMSALILCTPSLALSLHAAPYLDCGLSLPKCSYWRARTVLGRVLGSLPDISSINGWLGPCPPIVFDKQELLNDAGKPRHIRLKARPVAPFTGDSRLSRHDTIEQKPGEDYDAYVKSLNDLTKWAAPTPPTRQDMAYTLKAIRLTQLPLESSMEEKLAAQQITESKAESEAEFRASLVFRIEPSVKIMTFTLYSNPVFVTAPSCHLGPHEVHERHLLSFNRSAVTVDKLRDFEHDNGDDQAGIMLINATGKGAEVVARAWCAERGKNALIRRVNGPCYACAMRAASGAGLRLGVLIWVS